jgi:integrase
MGNRRVMVEQFGGNMPTDITPDIIENEMRRITTRMAVRDQALLAFLFLTGCRISEAVRYYPDKKVEAKLRADKNANTIVSLLDESLKTGSPRPYLSGITKRQIVWHDDHFVVHGLRTLKRRKVMSRTIPVLNSSLESWSWQALKKWYDECPTEELWGYTRQNAFHIVEKGTFLFPHFFRHARSTLLITTYNYPPHLLVRRHGWAKSSSADTYIHLSPNDELAQQRKFIVPQKEGIVPNEEGVPQKSA